MKLLFFACFASLTLAAAPLLDRLQGAKNGDFIVFEAGKTVTILAIRSVDQRKLILEEISVPAQSFKEFPASWPEWVKNKAPGHTSWSMVEIDLTHQEILECYSFSKCAWVHEEKGLISTLLSLPLSPINPNERRKIGPPPADGEADVRKQWNPPLVVNGKKLEKALFDVFETLWPVDGSELSGKKVSVYLDQENHSALPYWIQVETSHAVVSVRAIDSGKMLPSVHRSLPRRVPQFIGTEQKTAKGIRLVLKSPKYYKDFELYAVDRSQKERTILPILHTMQKGEGETVWIDIERQELLQSLQPDKRYTWLIVPLGYSESYTESRKPFLWKPSP